MWTPINDNAVAKVIADSANTGSNSYGHSTPIISY